MQVTQRDYGFPLRRFVRMRIREENCNMILLAMVVCINATIVGGASLLIGDSKPVRFVDRTTGSVEQASFGDKAIIDVGGPPPIRVVGAPFIPNTNPRDR
jgi:hypothetical protein